MPRVEVKGFSRFTDAVPVGNDCGSLGVRVPEWHTDKLRYSGTHAGSYTLCRGGLVCATSIGCNLWPYW
jgi:hypothetical protein